MKSQSLILVLLFVAGLSYKSTGQNTIKTEPGYTPHIGVVVSMLDDLKRRVTSSVVNLDQREIDFLLDENANRIGAMILHLAATEVYYQKYTMENRGFNQEERAEWDVALSLGAPARNSIKDQPIQYYLAIWDQVRQETRSLLKKKDDSWFAESSRGSSMNNHWAWYHVMEHQANHMGQIRLILSRIPED